MSVSRQELNKYRAGCLPPAENHIRAAKTFLLQKWQERAINLGRRAIPADLRNACKFASRFAHLVFGGRLRGNYHHQFIVDAHDTVLDLTDAAGLDDKTEVYKHDRFFWLNPDHLDSMRSVESSVQQWVEEFLAPYT